MLKRIISLFLGVVLFAQFTSTSSFAATKSFNELLYTNNIEVVGSTVYMSNYEFTKLVDSAENIPINENAKLTNKIEKTTDNILVTPEDILELHYYSLTSEEQSKFLTKISNQQVDVSVPGKGSVGVLDIALTPYLI